MYQFPGSNGVAKRLGTAYSIKIVSHPGFFLLLFQQNPKGFIKPLAKSGSETFDLVSVSKGFSEPRIVKDNVLKCIPRTRKAFKWGVGGVAVGNAGEGKR